MKIFLERNKKKWILKKVQEVENEEENESKKEGKGDVVKIEKDNGIERKMSVCEICPILKLRLWRKWRNGKDI